MNKQRTQLENDKRRPRRTEAGFTLIELLIVLTILGILLAIAIPSYLGFQRDAADTAAKSNLRAAIASVEAFTNDNIGAKGDADGKAGTSGYKGMTDKILRGVYDTGLASTIAVVASKTKVNQYCLTDTQRGRAWSLLGPPGGSVASSFRNNANCK